MTEQAEKQDLHLFQIPCNHILSDGKGGAFTVGSVQHFASLSHWLYLQGFTNPGG